MSYQTNTHIQPESEHIWGRVGQQRQTYIGAIILTALLAFEVFNYSTTDYALADLLGELNFLGLRWSTILAIAFCGIDFAGIARLFSPEEKNSAVAETWYLLGAWFLAATMNAMLTWWGVSIALINHQTQSSAIISTSILVEIVPIFVAIMVWLIRILLIGTISISGLRILAIDPYQPEKQLTQRNHSRPYTQQARESQYNRTPNQINVPLTGVSSNNRIRPEPIYQNLSGSRKSPSTDSRPTQYRKIQS